jgi:hypothetical protein
MKGVSAKFKAVLEEVLQLQVANSELEQAETLESLAEIVAERLGKTPNAIGPDVVRAFLDLRSAIASVTEMPRAELLPSTPWQMVLPDKNPGRRQVWKRIQKAAHASLPPLAWASWPWLMTDIASWTLAPFAYFVFGQGFKGTIGGILFLAVAIVVSAATARASGSSELPHKTLAESARHAATERWSPSTSGSRPWTSVEVLAVLRELSEIGVTASTSSGAVEPAVAAPQDRWKAAHHHPATTSGPGPWLRSRWADYKAAGAYAIRKSFAIAERLESAVQT